MSHHRAYQPLLPCASKYLQQKWDKTAQDLHKQKVTNPKPSKGLSAPPYTLGLLTNRQRTQKDKEKEQILKENRRMRHNLKISKPHYSARKWAAEWVKTCEVRNRIARYPRGRAIQHKKQEIRVRMNNTEDQPLLSDETLNSSSSNKTHEEQAEQEEEDSGAVNQELNAQPAWTK